MSNSVKEIIQKYQMASVEQISNETPATLSAELLILSAKYMMAGAEVLETEQLKTAKWLDIRKTYETDKQAEEAIKMTPEYANYIKAKYLEKTLVEMLRSIKKLLQSKGDEMRNLGY